MGTRLQKYVYKVYFQSEDKSKFIQRLYLAISQNKTLNYGL